jgi:erythronate-4-phosphate dehydrogenase
MIIAVDEKIPYWEQAFPQAGEVRLFSARKVRTADLGEAEAMVVRSVTRVDAQLLEGTRVRFVGTATIGMDHLDEKYLRERGIYFTNAAGSNANAVAEHIVAALLLTARRRSWDLARKSMAVIGVGHVGSRVVHKAACLGISTLLCDPPLRESTGDGKYMSLDEVLDADILTLHVPLTKEGRHPTWHMFDETVLGRLTPRQFLLNTSRGAVIDNRALKHALERHALEGAALDVWEGEPRIDYELLRATELGSVLQAFDILVPDANLRALERFAPDVAASAFDRLRNDYPLRPEFRHFMVELDAKNEELAAPLSGLGFLVSKPVPASSPIA